MRETKQGENKEKRLMSREMGIKERKIVQKNRTLLAIGFGAGLLRILLPFWLGVSCLFLLAAGREGRVYTGRKKLPALTAQRLRSGPHFCISGIGGGCCPGWTVSPSTGQCLQPLCSFGCGSGFCIAPNLCSCRDGLQGVTCSDDFASEHEKDLEDKGFPPNCLSAMCDHHCRVVNGIPMCSCFHGYSIGKDGKTCYDIDECTRPQAMSLCQQQCKNSIGSYRCICYYGYQLSSNGRSCIPNKHPNIIAAPAPCGEYGCELSCNDGGCEHISRVCPIGFSMTETANGVTCTDIDECAAASCDGSCINTEGGFMCDCAPGLKLAADRSSCSDIDECSAHRSLCQQRCKNFHGSYKCLCAIGFTLHSNGHKCTDINECRRPATSHICHHFCHNTHGSFFCSCRAGFILGTDKVSCVDIDECLESTTLCVLGSCVNTMGSYYCTCAPGFLATISGCSEIPLEEQTVSLPQVPQTTYGDLALLKSTSLVHISSRRPTISTSQISSTTPMLSQEMTTMSTSAPQSTLPDLDSLPPPQYLKTSHYPLAQIASGISHMQMKEDILIHPGTPTIPHTHPLSSPCWHNNELQISGSYWTESGCLNCTCQEGKVLCERRICNSNCSHPDLHPNSCCPSCDGCLFEGVSRADGELFPQSPDNCTICVCLSGNVTCIPPACPPVTCSDPSISDCCLRCPDGCEFQGQIYPHGAKFSRDENGCTSCLCQNGEVECSFLPCPSLECPREDWVLEAGQCCYKCQDPPQRSGCPFDDNGIEIPVGQIWSPGDPCAICICQADSSILCKKTDCVDTCPHPIPVPGQCCPDCSAGCFYGKRTYRNNESFPSTSDQCLTCICLMGTVACSPIECAPSCTYPFHDEGECCPVCRDCTYEGRKVLNGQSFSLESQPCTHCTCQEGEVNCEAILCSTSCSHPYIFPGECCSTCEECALEDHVLENGSSYILKTDPCVVCHCSAGNVLCEQRDISCPACEQKTQDCLNELPDSFYTKHSTIVFQRDDSPNLIEATSSESSRLSLVQILTSRRNTATTETIMSHSTTLNPLLQSPDVPVTPYKTQISAQSSSSDGSLMDSPLSSFPTSIFFQSQQFPSSTTTHPSYKLSKIDPSISPKNHEVVQVISPVVDLSSYSTTVSANTSVSRYSPESSTKHLGLSSSSQHPVRLSLLPEHSAQPSILPKNVATSTLAPTRFPSNVFNLDEFQMQEKHVDMKSIGLVPVQITGCSLNGFNITSGSIFIADTDNCMHCDSLNGRILCKPDTDYPTGLCCQGCSILPADSCTAENNQIHSGWTSGREFCKCRKVFLQCQSCSYTEGCYREDTPKSTESDQITNHKEPWIPLLFEEKRNFTDGISVP
ncbi:von Willebrand factor C and EGF domain-containing protein [Bombina bombina]|uniref:von Willebrand factor C and EGF domain-containing protein n=1 Tax=Bombina bombina TaxID=8345 RepID=UPI00235A7E8E|nr:von Willebrand factor C and EGF domain-containing protein [Bombina bombina]